MADKKSTCKVPEKVINKFEVFYDKGKNYRVNKFFLYAEIFTRK